MEELIDKVTEWANGKDIVYPKNADRQFMKFIEEVFEFKTELDVINEAMLVLHNNRDNYSEDQIISKERYINAKKINLRLEMGDILVTLIILSKQLDIDLVNCLQLAYDKIKYRKGKTIDGVFVKEEDL